MIAKENIQSNIKTNKQNLTKQTQLQQTTQRCVAAASECTIFSIFRRKRLLMLVLITAEKWTDVKIGSLSGCRRIRRCRRRRCCCCCSSRWRHGDGSTQLAACGCVWRSWLIGDERPYDKMFASPSYRPDIHFCRRVQCPQRGCTAATIYIRLEVQNVAARSYTLCFKKPDTCEIFK